MNPSEAAPVPPLTAVSTACSSAEERLRSLQASVAPLYQRLGAHPLYRSIHTLPHLHLFMESHVFAVWDFMSLLKALQRGLTCVDVPWRPSPLPEARRLINEIVLGEESDLYQGEALSHFELYLRAMHDAGASTDSIDTFLAALTPVPGQDSSLALALESVPEPARTFVRSTFHFIHTGELHCIAAAFTFGREDLIPDLFTAFIRDQNDRLSGRLDLFRWYLDRHIEVDGEEHGPMALRMVSALCGSDAGKWAAAQTAAITAIEARLALWDALHHQLTTGTTPPA